MYTPYQSVHAQNAPSWWSRNWKWFVPGGCAALLLIGFGFVALIVTLVFGTMRSSEIFQVTMSRVRSDEQLQRELGTPIEPGWTISGTINVNDESGDADFFFPISGPKNEGVVHAVASRSRGAWRFEILEVGIEGMPERIDLLESTEP